MARTGRRARAPCASRCTAAEVDGDAHWTGTHWRLKLHTPAGPLALALHIAGAHNVRNALAAAAAALAAGAPLSAVRAGLEAFRPVKGRSAARAMHLAAATPATLIDDSYNANPDSVRAAIDVLAGLPGPRWLLLGDMGEVGDQGPAFHAEVGAYAARARHRGAVVRRPDERRRGRRLRPRGAPFRRYRGADRRARRGPRCRVAAGQGFTLHAMERVVQAIAERAADTPAGKGNRCCLA